ncbi:MAG: hypothetical protein NZ551_04525, partial [Microscillaceae bacterium]|nr:hypothetical protein [Microscillaceae bacterium]MDW8460457.1 hypothetical protein [Cytophagales bacterium]
MNNPCNKQSVIQTISNNKNKLVLKLRFPEFKDSEKWELMQINDILIAESSSLILNKLNSKKSGYAV